MTLEQLQARIREWDLQNSDSAAATSRFSTIFNELSYHAEREWRLYLPAEHPDFDPNYMERLAAWIGNLFDEGEQKLLLEYALQISFFSHDDFAALYRSAFNREITCWVAAQIGARLEPDGYEAFQARVHSHLHRRTWFCPVTDSMDINEFYKVNHLKGVGHRPGFSTLQMLAEDAATPDPELSKNVLHYMENPSLDIDKPLPSLEHVVLLEDIVGSASQCLAAIRWAVNNLGKPVLFVPLLLCPNGVEALRAEEQASNGLLTVRPVVELGRRDLLGPERRGSEGWPQADQLEALAVRYNHRVDGDPFGYRDTGCSLTTFSNTPNNTLPIVHNKPQNGSWQPLFPRVYRD